MAKKTTLSKARQEEYRLAVQRVNKQMRRLEKHYGMQEGSKLYSTAYVGIQKYIKKHFGEQKTFSKEMPADMNIFRSRINAIRRFYEKPSSTLSGMHTVYEKHAVTLSRIFSDSEKTVKITADDLKDFFDNGLWKAVEDKYGSGKTMRYWRTIERQKGRIIEQLNQGKKVTLRGKYAKDVNSLGLDSMLREYLIGQNVIPEEGVNE